MKASDDKRWTGWAMGLAGLAWLPVGLVLAQMGRIEWALAHPDQQFQFVPGTGWYAGPGATLGINWLHVMALTGSALLLSVTLWVGLAVRRCLGEEPGWRPRIQSGPVVAMGLMLTWVLTIDHREFNQNVLPLVLVFYTPIVAVSYALLGSGLGRLRSVGLGGLMLIGLALTIGYAQSRFEKPGNELPEVDLMFWGSVPLGLAVAMRLAIWGWAGDREANGAAEAASA